jgi:hypothetical protein
MSSYMQRQLAVALFGVAILGTVEGCSSLCKCENATLSKNFWRAAKGGGYVTLDVTIRPGEIPEWNIPPRFPDTIAFITNRGEGGKNEKRYDLKPSSTARYVLVLSRDPSPSIATQWSLYELGQTKPHRTGHLAPCETYHPAIARDLAFRDCVLPVKYDPLETAFQLPTGSVIFASYLLPDKEPLVPTDATDAAAWISCNSGCCSLGI